MVRHPRAELSAYLDGELAADEASEIERHLRDCTECSRELAIMNNLGGAMRAMQTRPPTRGIWDGVHRRITQPVGWILLLSGAAVWFALAVAAWLRAELTLAWLVATAVGVGVFLLLVAIGYEQYRDWKETRYRDVER
ncbi:MAG TPA: zf-HC2 domain-containing protein [Longimicrobiales bacterium]|nr:zf-HC2 domain-containing protein [Longimicrobiales bacterium]